MTLSTDTKRRVRITLAFGPWAGREGWIEREAASGLTDPGVWVSFPETDDDGPVWFRYTEIEAL